VLQIQQKSKELNFLNLDGTVVNTNCKKDACYQLEPPSSAVARIVIVKNHWRLRGLALRLNVIFLSVRLAL